VKTRNRKIDCLKIGFACIIIKPVYPMKWLALRA
jgi:hypothetical protein